MILARLTIASLCLQYLDGFGVNVGIGVVDSVLLLASKSKTSLSSKGHSSPKGFSALGLDENDGIREHYLPKSQWYRTEIF